MATHAGSPHGSEKTARLAVIAGLPGLALIVLAALSTDSLALHADLILSVVDMLLLLVVWAVASRTGSGRAEGRRAARAEHLACTLAACCMILSMSVVAWFAAGRIGTGGMAPGGAGAWMGLTLNAIYAVVNLALLRRWRLRYRDERTAFVRSQICLFCDKLCTNLIVTGSLAIALGVPESWLGRHADPIGGLLIAATTARWTAPVVRDALRGMWIAWSRRRRRQARPAAA